LEVGGGHGNYHYHEQRKSLHAKRNIIQPMADSQPPPHAGVSFPPPFLYVAAFVAGLLLHRVWPLTIAGLGHKSARGAVLAAGMVLLLAWLALMVSAFAMFRRAHTTIIPNLPAAALVTGGPYRISRNPMYLALALGYAGLALMLNKWWPVILLPIALIAIDRLVIAREERYLAGAFRDEFGAYARRVRRWV
jgi:protein-S-isoprenylcysteine O-methyltransferase Ste14